MLTNNQISKFKKAYKNKGYVLVKNFIDKKRCKKALIWLNNKNKKKLAKTWTVQEPGVDLAVLFLIHSLKKNPLSTLANDKKVLNLVCKFNSASIARLKVCRAESKRGATRTYAILEILKV